MFNKEILANPDASVPHCHCATIAIHPTGEILVAWYAYPEIETKEGRLILARRRPNAKRFDKPKRILDQLSQSLGNPVLFFDEFGCLHLLFVTLRGHYWDSAVVNASRSDDFGQTWAIPELLRLDEGMMVRSPPVRRQNGYLLLPAYNEKKNESVMLTADASAEGWFPVEHMEGESAIQGCVVRQGETDLAMLLRPVGDTRVCLRSISGDDGRSWSRVMPTTLPNPLSGVSAVQVNGTLLAVYNHTTQHQRYPLSLSCSTNRGTSWSQPIHIDETPHEVSYPSFATDGNDVVHGVYTFGRSRIQYVTFDIDFWGR